MEKLDKCTDNVLSYLKENLFVSFTCNLFIDKEKQLNLRPDLWSFTLFKLKGITYSMKNLFVIENIDKLDKDSNIKTFTSWSLFLPHAFVSFGHNFTSYHNLKGHIVLIIKALFPAGINLIPASLCTIQEEGEIILGPGYRISFISSYLRMKKEILLKKINSDHIICETVFKDIQENFKNECFWIEAEINQI